MRDSRDQGISPSNKHVKIIWKSYDRTCDNNMNYENHVTENVKILWQKMWNSCDRQCEQNITENVKIIWNTPTSCYLHICVHMLGPKDRAPKCEHNIIWGWVFHMIFTFPIILCSHVLSHVFHIFYHNILTVSVTLLSLFIFFHTFCHFIFTIWINSQIPVSLCRASYNPRLTAPNIRYRRIWGLGP